jgi:8-oxo-dGTP pyrophosphatase MutT (NUDIX family)
MHQEEPGYEKSARAGLIPFLRGDDGVLRYLVMVASDPKFGGPRPMISKGKIEAGEDAFACAVREAEEELGFKQRNNRGSYISIFSGRVALYSCAYDLTVYGVEIQDRYDFDKWCDETEYVMWMSLEEFQAKGRKDHVRFIEELERMIS